MTALRNVVGTKNGPFLPFRVRLTALTAEKNNIKSFLSRRSGATRKKIKENRFFGVFFFISRYSVNNGKPKQKLKERRPLIKNNNFDLIPR